MSGRTLEQFHNRVNRLAFYRGRDTIVRFGGPEVRCRKRIMRLVRYNHGRPVWLGHIVKMMGGPSCYGSFDPEFTRAILHQLLADKALMMVGNNRVVQHVSQLTLL